MIRIRSPRDAAVTPTNQGTQVHKQHITRPRRGKIKATSHQTPKPRKLPEQPCRNRYCPESSLRSQNFLASLGHEAHLNRLGGACFLSGRMSRGSFHLAAGGCTLHRGTLLG